MKFVQSFVLIIRLNFRKLIVFLFFFNRKSSYVRKQTFSEKNFACKIQFFVRITKILDTIILAFFSFSLNFFFQKRWKFLFLLNGVFIYALINAW